MGLFPADADKEWVQARRLGGVEHGHWAGTRRDHPALGKTDPLVSVLTEELVADSPVFHLVLPPVGVNLPGGFQGQLVGNAFHRSPQVHRRCPWEFYSSKSPTARS